MQNAGLGFQRQLEHIHHAHQGRFNGFNRIPLVVHRGCRTGQVVDIIKLPPERLGDIMQDKGKFVIIQEVVDIGLRSGEQVVHHRDFMSAFQQTA